MFGAVDVDGERGLENEDWGLGIPCACVVGANGFEAEVAAAGCDECVAANGFEAEVDAAGCDALDAADDGFPKSTVPRLDEG